MAVRTVNRAQILVDLPSVLEAYSRVDMIAMDTETSGLDRHADDVMVVSLGAPGLPPAVLHVAGVLDPQLITLLSQKVLLGHNVTSFDIPFLAKYGYNPLTSAGWIDTMITEQLCVVSDRRSIRKNLAETVKRRTNSTLNKNIDHAGWVNPELSDEQLSYAAGDVTLLHEVHRAQMAKLQELHLEDAYQNEMAAQRATAMITIRGMPIVLEETVHHVGEVRQEMNQLGKDLESKVGGPFNPGSSVQVKQAFANLFSIQLRATDAETITKVADHGGPAGEFARQVVEFRQLKKASMYNEDWIRNNVSSDGRIRSSYWQMGTDTGRYSCSDPNLQQWPKALRTLIGYQDDADQQMLSVDYSQIEILIASLLCNEPALTEAVLNSDVHTYVASLVFGTPEDQVDKRHRKMAKAASFTLLFAGGLLGLIRSAALSGEPITAQDAERVRYGFYQAFPRVSQYLNGIRNTTAYRNDHNMGLSVRVPGGPVRFLYGETLTPSMVVNTLVQGTAAVGLKQALTMICDAGLGEYLCAVVHDEIVLDVPKFGATDIQKEVEQCMILGMEKILRKQPRVASTLGSRWGTSGVAHKEGEHVRQAK